MTEINNVINIRKEILNIFHNEVIEYLKTYIKIYENIEYTNHNNNIDYYTQIFKNILTNIENNIKKENSFITDKNFIYITSAIKKLSLNEKNIINIIKINGIDNYNIDFTIELVHLNEKNEFEFTNINIKL